MKRLIVYNCDPTPGEDVIVSADSNVGHTWLSVDDQYLGRGYRDGDPYLGATVPGT